MVRLPPALFAVSTALCNCAAVLTLIVVCAWTLITPHKSSAPQARARLVTGFRKNTCTIRLLKFIQIDSAAVDRPQLSRENTGQHSRAKDRIPQTVSAW